jgi:uncharacterized membrane protein
VPRQRYIDWARAIAVLIMIEAHTLDSWTRPADRHSLAFRNAQILGGFAAPLFLWLAGVSVALAAASVSRRALAAGASAAKSRTAGMDAICKRGIEVFLLAFLFRLQSFIVTPGGSMLNIFRVDILNIMGPSIVAAGLVWGLFKRDDARLFAYAALTGAIAMLTPIVRASAMIERLPLWMQWYLRPAGELTMFTVFPWAGFVFAGAAVGTVIALVSGTDDERRVQTWFAAGGAVLVVLGFVTANQPTIYRPASYFWTSSPTWFAIRTGIMMIALAALYFAARFAARAGIELLWLEKMGRSSLFVYWIHVELVYGYASWFWRGRLPLWGVGVAYVIFAGLMYGAILLRDRFWKPAKLRMPPVKPPARPDFVPQSSL